MKCKAIDPNVSENLLTRDTFMLSIILIMMINKVLACFSRSD